MYHYKDKKLLVEGPINNMKPSLMQFSKPKPMSNNLNPGSHFMKTTTYDAKEALNHFGVPSRRGNHRPPSNNHHQGDSMNYLPRDNMTSISSHFGPQGSVNPNNAGLPIPVGLFMNMSHIPPRFYNKQRMMYNNEGKYYKSLVKSLKLTFGTLMACELFICCLVIMSSVKVY